MTAHISHLAGFLIDILHKNKHYKASFGNDENWRCLLDSGDPGLPLSVANF